LDQKGGRGEVAFGSREAPFERRGNVNMGTNVWKDDYPHGPAIS